MSYKLQRFISLSANLSSRKSGDSIKNGEVSINGKTVLFPWEIVVPADEIKLNGKKMRLKRQEPLFFALYKPKNCVTTLDDPEGRDTITKYFPHGVKNIFPAGRLDYNAEGLVLLTNDGQTAYKLTHPSCYVTKIYLVKIKGLIKTADITSIRKGPKVRGQSYLPMSVKKLHTINDKSWIEVGLQEGKNHQIKKIFFDYGYPVLKIKRFSIGPINIGLLTPGQVRPLTIVEIEALKKL